MLFLVLKVCVCLTALCLFTEYNWQNGSHNVSYHLMTNTDGTSSTAGTFSCNTCQKTYYYKRNLLRHQKYECGLEPQFQCPYCNKRTKLKSNLMKHIKNCRIFLSLGTPALAAVVKD